MQGETYLTNGIGSYRFLVIGRDHTGEYGRVTNATGRSVRDAVAYAQTFSHFADVRRFKVVDTQDGTVTNVEIERRSNTNDRRQR